jgi:hypothetical protein
MTFMNTPPPCRYYGRRRRTDVRREGTGRKFADGIRQPGYKQHSDSDDDGKKMQLFRGLAST